MRSFKSEWVGRTSSYTALRVIDEWNVVEERMDGLCRVDALV